MSTATRIEFMIYAPSKDDALFAATQTWAALKWTPTNSASVKAVRPGLWSARATVPAPREEVLRDHRAVRRALQASGRPTDIGTIRPARRRPTP